MQKSTGWWNFMGSLYVYNQSPSRSHPSVGMAPPRGSTVSIVEGTHVRSPRCLGSFLVVGSPRFSPGFPSTWSFGSPVRFGFLRGFPEAPRVPGFFGDRMKSEDKTYIFWAHDLSLGPLASTSHTDMIWGWLWVFLVLGGWKTSLAKKMPP